MTARSNRDMKQMGSAPNVGRSPATEDSPDLNGAGPDVDEEQEAGPPDDEADADEDQEPDA